MPRTSIFVFIVLLTWGSLFPYTQSEPSVSSTSVSWEEPMDIAVDGNPFSSELSEAEKG